MKYRLANRGERSSEPEYGLLYEQDVTAGLLHLFDNVEYVLALITQHTVHLGVVRYYHLVVHLNTATQHRRHHHHHQQQQQQQYKEHPL